MRIVFVDSLDSFAWNLVHALAHHGDDVTVLQSEGLTATRLLSLRPDRVVLGPGPGAPCDAGGLVSVVRPLAAARVPTLGVCLGLQAIALAFGARVDRTRAVHGEADAVFHDGRGLFATVPQGAAMTRYHSLCAVESTVLAPLEVSARTADGTVMGLRHLEAPMAAVQFHPESVLSGAAGQLLLDGFLSGRALPSAALAASERLARA